MRKKPKPNNRANALNLSGKEMDQLFKFAQAVCRRKNFPADDPEFASAINYGLLKAMQAYVVDGPRTLKSLVALFALRNCAKTVNRLNLWERQNLAGAERGRRSPPVETPIPLTDYEVLCFVARHGRKRAALLLGWDHKKLRKLLDEIVLRVRAYGKPAELEDDGTSP